MDNLDDFAWSEYKKRIEKIKSEQELEKIKLDEIKELKKQIVVEYEQKKDEFEQKLKEIDQKQQEIDEKSKKINEKQAILDEKERQFLSKNLVILLEDGDFAVVGRDDVDIVCDESVIKSVIKE